jgi:hypothetical protein
VCVCAWACAHTRTRKPEYLSQYSDGLWAGSLMAGGSTPSSGKIFLCSVASGLALGPTPVSYPVGTIRYPPQVKWLGLGSEAVHSPPSAHEVKNGGAVPPLHHMSSWHSAELIKHRDYYLIYRGWTK